MKFSFKVVLAGLTVLVLITGLYMKVSNKFLTASLIVEEIEEDDSVVEEVDAKTAIEQGKKKLNEARKTLSDMKQKMKKYEEQDFEDLADGYEDSFGELQDALAENPEDEDEEQAVGEQVLEIINEMDEIADEFYAMLADKTDKTTDKKEYFKVAPSTKELEKMLKDAEKELRAFQKVAKGLNDKDVSFLVKEMNGVLEEAQTAFEKEEFDSAQALVSERWPDMKTKFDEMVSQIQEAIRTQKIQEQLKIVQEEIEKKNEIFTNVRQQKKVSKKVKKACGKLLDQKEEYLRDMEDFFEEGELEDAEMLVKKIEKLNKKTDKKCKKVYGKSEKLTKPTSIKSKSVSPTLKPFSPNPRPVAPNPRPIKGR